MIIVDLSTDSVAVDGFAALSDEPLSVDIQYVADELTAPVVLSVAGRFDRDAIVPLIRALRTALRRRPAVVLLALSRISSLDWRALSTALRAAAHTVSLCDGHMRTIATPGQPAFHAIVNTGLARRVALRPTLEAALAEDSAN